MKNQDVEQRLKKDVEEITPNVIDSALEKCGGVSQREKIRKRQPRVWQICGRGRGCTGAYYRRRFLYIQS